MADSQNDLENLFNLAKASIEKNSNLYTENTKNSELRTALKKIDSGHEIALKKPSSGITNKNTLAPKPPVSAQDVPSIETIDSIANSDVVRPSESLKKKIREETTGPGWFDMKSPVITDQVKQELHVLKMRNVINPKRFYKKDSKRAEIPKHFQFGRIIEGPADFYSSRMTKKERKSTIIEELLADSQARSYLKKKYKQETLSRENSRVKLHLKKKKFGSQKK
ncbi:rRNA-processing protein fcf2 [Smittium culicis]|uniref:rRNA-processing protein fcf2 n=1 Tax=Smittium culicis TaxID=133412 RepID=A0A1R1XVX2_9FUNG|nr:rRNA-processing protein fcf2 [Smittium culicis]